MPPRAAPSLLCLLAAATLLAGFVAPGPASHRRPATILVVIDGLRSDHFAPCGYGGHTMPTLERLAGEGILFGDTYCQSTEARLGCVSLLSSRYPSEAARIAKGGITIPFDLRTLPRVAHTYGMRTAGFVGCAAVGATPGLRENFAVFRCASACRSLESLVPDLAAWLREDREAPPLAFLFLCDVTHGDAPVGSTYDARLGALDRQLGALLAALAAEGLSRHDTLLIVASVRGESLPGDSSLPAPGLSREAVRVPLVLWGKGIHRPPGLPKDGHITQNLDIAPTALAALAIPLPGGLRGKDLLAARDGASTAAFTEGYPCGSAVTTSWGQLAAGDAPPASRAMVSLLEGEATPASLAFRGVDGEGEARSERRATLRSLLLHKEREVQALREAPAPVPDGEVLKMLRRHGYW